MRTKTNSFSSEIIPEPEFTACFRVMRGPREGKPLYWRSFVSSGSVPASAASSPCRRGEERGEGLVAEAVNALEVIPHPPPLALQGRGAGHCASENRPAMPAALLTLLMCCYEVTYYLLSLTCENSAGPPWRR